MFDDDDDDGWLSADTARSVGCVRQRRSQHSSLTVADVLRSQWERYELVCVLST